MLRIIYLSIIFLAITFSFCAQPKSNVSQSSYEKKTVSLVSLDSLPPVLEKGNYNELEGQDAYVILKQGTERAFTGAYHDNKEKGVYICKQCNQPLFTSESKFDSGTGWPSFDDGFEEGAVVERTDADGYRVEIICGNCDGHIGHVFKGEGFTDKQTRHCANSASLNFIRLN